MKVKVVIKNGDPNHEDSGVFNAETGEMLLVRRVDFSPIEPDGRVYAKLDMLIDEVDIECDAEIAKQNIEATQKPFYMRRWWVRTRPCKNAVQVGDSRLPACHEFCVPWYAWPLELAYRAIFGKAVLND